MQYAPTDSHPKARFYYFFKEKLQITNETFIFTQANRIFKNITMEYYISRNDRKEGPFTLDELPEKRIAPDTLIWAVGYKEWKQAKDVPELESILYSTPPDIPVQKPMPKTWLVESILVTLFCCLPFGIVGIVYASKVSTLLNIGQYDEAVAASKEAGKWVKIGFITGLIGIILYVLVVFLAFQRFFVEGIASSGLKG